jgi:16S rRNA (uracil1498-N3)-methyltransferase
MPAYDFTAPRLFVAADLAAGVVLPLDRAQANYLLNVLRKGPDDPVLLFNGRDGEWRAALVQTGRKGADLHVAVRTRPQTPPADLHYLFAPLKSARLDYLAQKAVEMGAGTIRPVITRFTQGDRINMDRLRANAVEAAEQCGVLAIPDCPEPERLPKVLEGLAPERLLVFCDEGAPVRDPVRALGAAADPAVPPPLASCGPTPRPSRCSPWSRRCSATRAERPARRAACAGAHAVIGPGDCPPGSDVERRTGRRCRVVGSRRLDYVPARTPPAPRAGPGSEADIRPDPARTEGVNRADSPEQSGPLSSQAFGSDARVGSAWRATATTPRRSPRAPN